MKQLLHTLYITEKDSKLSLHGEAIEITLNDSTLIHIPLINIECIVSFSFLPISQKLMEECAKRHIQFLVLNKNGKVKFKISGSTYGNPKLRMLQCKLAENHKLSLEIGKTIIKAKAKNSIYLLLKYKWNHPKENKEIDEIITSLKNILGSISNVSNMNSLRGKEGVLARTYFKAFNNMIRLNDPKIKFKTRESRPPKDPYNALLSLSYVLLTNMCIGALEAVGLDPYLGIIHQVKSGKPCLALDLIEELRSPIADRFVFKLINLKIISLDQFELFEENWKLNDEAIKIFFDEWEKMKCRKIFIKEINEKIPLGLLPYYQAQLLSRFIYGKELNYKPYEIYEI